MMDLAQGGMWHHQQRWDPILEFQIHPQHPMLPLPRPRVWDYGYLQAGMDSCPSLPQAQSKVPRRCQGFQTCPL